MKTIQEIQDDIIARGWALTSIAQHWGWEATIHDLSIETEEDLYIAPLTTQYDDTEEKAIRKVYNRALEYLPTLPDKYDEHGISYKIVGNQNAIT